MLEVIETQSHLINLQQGRMQAIENKMVVLEDRVAETKSLQAPAEQEYYSANQVARQLGLFTAASNLPHVLLVNQIAFRAGIPAYRKKAYEDRNVRITVALIHAEREVETHIVEYTQEGVRKITEWFEENKATTYFKTFRKRTTTSGNAGDIKNHGYRIGKRNYYIA